MYDSRQPGSLKHGRSPAIEVQWRAITYRTVALYSVLAIVIVCAGVYVARPEWLSRTFERVSHSLVAAPSDAAALAQNQARFVNLDGKVEIKRANSVTWENADYRTTLDRGDLIRTGDDGAARLTFVDGTTYTIKSNSFVTVEQNYIDRGQSTSVAVHISSGAVDLATGTWQSPRSRAEVSFANARASLKENSRAAVRTDPGSDENQITVSAGSADLQAGNQHVAIGEWERVTYNASSGTMAKTTVLAPPNLMAPLNLQPLIEEDPKHATVHFAWAAIPEAASYSLRVSTNSMFTRIAAEKVVTGTSQDLSGFDPGDYFWSVTAIDAHKKESAPSDAFKFTLISQGKSEEMLLEVDETELHGNVVELVGRTEPSAALIINGEAVADIRPDGRFRYFTQPLSRGSHEIVVTGQNRRGGTAIKRVSIAIP
jgi:FecR protein